VFTGRADYAKELITGAEKFLNAYHLQRLWNEHKIKKSKRIAGVFVPGCLKVVR